MEKKKVLHYCISTHLGGAEQSLLSLVKNSHSQDWEHHLLLPKEDGPLIDELHKCNINYSVVPMPSSFMSLSRQKRNSFSSLLSLFKIPSYLSQLTREVRKTQPDLICTTGVKCHLLITFIKLRVSCPIVWYVRDIFSSSLLKSTFLTLGQLAKVSVISNSSATKESFPIASEVIFNGFDIPSSQLERADFLHQRLNLPSQAPLVGILGAFAHWKGQKDFLHMAAQLIHEKSSKAHFVLIGDEIYDTRGDKKITAELKELCKKLDIEKHVHFTGFLKETDLALQSLNILVHASIHPEPFGRVIVEGMLNHTPVVAADAGGAKEIIENGISGYLCPAQDTNAYVTKIETLLKNKSLNQEISQNAYRRAVSHFSMKTYVEKVHSFFNRCI